MRPIAGFGMAVVFPVAVLVSEAQAQTGPQSHGAGPNRAASRTAPSRAGSGRVGWDPLRPYGAPGWESAGAGRYARPALVAERNEAARPSMFPRGRNYFPGLRSGQAPNRNVVDTRTLCVPGRHHFLHR
jgi:hypothetical protein